MEDLNWALRETGASIVGVSSESVREEGQVSNLLDTDKSTRWLAGTAPQYVTVKLANKHPSLHYVGWDMSKHTTNNIKIIEIAVASSTDLQEQLYEQLLIAHKMKVIMRCEAIPGAGVQLWRLPEPITQDIEYIRFTVLSTFDNGSVSLNNLYLLESESSLIGNYNATTDETLNATNEKPIQGSSNCDERVCKEKWKSLPSSNSKQADNTASSESKAALPYTPSLTLSREESYLNKLNFAEESAQITATLPSVAFPHKEELELKQHQQQECKEPNSNKGSMICEDKRAQVNSDNKTNRGDTCVLEHVERNERKEETFTQGLSPTEPHVPSQTAISQNNTTMPHRSPSSRVQQLLKDLNDDICMLKPIKIISPRRNLLHYLPDNLPEELDNFELGAEHELGNYRNSEFIGSEPFSRANIQRSPGQDERPPKQQEEQEQLANQRRQRQTTDRLDSRQRTNSNNNNKNNNYHRHHSNKKNKRNSNNKDDEDHNREDELQKCKMENTRRYVKRQSKIEESEEKEKKQRRKHTHRHHSRHLQGRQSSGNAADNKSTIDSSMIMYMKRIEHLERAVASLTTIVQQQRKDLSVIKQALLRQCLQNRHDKVNSNTDHATHKVNYWNSEYANNSNSNNHAYSSITPPFESSISAPITANSTDNNRNNNVNNKLNRKFTENLNSPTAEKDEYEQQACISPEHADIKRKSDQEQSNGTRNDEHEPDSALRHYVRSILNKYLRKEVKKLESASFAKIDDHLHDLIQRISDVTSYDMNSSKSSNHINVKIETFSPTSSVSGKLEEIPLLNHNTQRSVKTEEHEYIPVYFRTIPSLQEQDMEG